MLLDGSSVEVMVLARNVYLGQLVQWWTSLASVMKGNALTYMLSTPNPYSPSSCLDRDQARQ